MNSNMNIQVENDDGEMIVLAEYKVIKQGKYETEITIRFDRIISKIYNLFLRYFTKNIELEAPEKEYTKILTITENGVERLEKITKNIMLFISKEDMAGKV